MGRCNDQGLGGLAGERAPSPWLEGLWVRAASIGVGLFLSGLGPAQAGQDLPSADPIDARVLILSAQLSCAACETATAADPQGDLAGQLQRELRSLVQQGRSDAQVVEALIARYGGFVRYGPAVDDGDTLVWGFILLAALMSGALVIRVIEPARVKLAGQKSGVASEDASGRPR